MAPVWAAPPVVDLSNPPSTASAETTALRKALADMTIDLDQLRNDVRQLRGQIEVQTHEIETLKARTRDSLADTDKRLSEVEKRATVPEKAVPDVPVVGAGEQKEYDAAFALMKKGDYARAGKAFRDFIAHHPQSDLAGSAQYWIGESFYVVSSFKQALAEYTKVIDNYPNATKLPDALLKIGYSQQELGAPEKARDALQQVVTRFPNTSPAKLAEARLAELKPVENKPKPKPPAKPAAKP
jgi:tol-pal system protein YbgF